MWPDLAKLFIIFKSLWPFLEQLSLEQLSLEQLSIWQNCEPTLANFSYYWANIHCSKYWNIKIAIWSHWTSRPVTFRCSLSWLFAHLHLTAFKRDTPTDRHPFFLYWTSFLDLKTSPAANFDGNVKGVAAHDEGDGGWIRVNPLLKPRENLTEWPDWTIFTFWVTFKAPCHIFLGKVA